MKVRNLLLLSVLLGFQMIPTAQAVQPLDAVLPEMIAIPAGQFEMGCVSGISCEEREEPVHTVTIKAFELAKTEVTAALWAACVEAKGCDYVPEDNGFTDANIPVRYVSWDDVKVFLSWLNTETNSEYRLPTEAEWEYAARAGTKTPFSTGYCISDQQANSEANTFKAGNCNLKGENRKKVLPVASFPPNPFGLYDMQGNVWEWIEDCWHQDYDDAPTDGSAWLGTAGNCQYHVMRGGAWHGVVSHMRSAYRFRSPQKMRTGGLGFRLARSLP